MTRLRIYENHSRDLIYDGDIEDPRVRLLPPNEVWLDGRLRRVVNVDTEPGLLCLWVTALS